LRSITFHEIDQVFALTQRQALEFYKAKPVKSIWLLNCILSNQEIRYLNIYN